MFPSNLHKNIRELDKQISLLETECENMQVEKSKRIMNGKNSKVYNNKTTSLKSPPVKDTNNKPFVTGPSRSFSAGSSRRTVPPVLSKLHSVSSVPCKDVFKKSARKSSLPVMEMELQKGKMGSSQTSLNPSLTSGKGKQESHRCSNCDCEKKKDEESKRVLHKEVLFSNPESTIEVTVMKKSSKNGEVNRKRSVTVIKECSESGSDKGKCCACKRRSEKDTQKNRERKWSEILSDKNKALLNDKNHDHCHLNTSGLYEHICTSPRSSPSPKANVAASPCEKLNHKEKEIQCTLWNSEPVKCEVDLYNPIRNLHFLIDELKGNQNEEEKKIIFNEMEIALQKICNERTKKNYNMNSQSDREEIEAVKENSYVGYLQKNYDMVKKMCDKLTAEKEQALNDVSAKDKLLANMYNKEKEYLSLISSLKFNLEKTKEQAEDSVKLLKELNIIKNQLLKETKVADALRKSHSKMQERVEKCLLENDKLRTHLRMNKLEAQKFNVLLAGKDVELKRYKEEIESFQKQISDQLAALRSNAAVNEVEKAMEAIIHHSQIFSQTDLESNRSDSKLDQRPKSSSSRTRDKLMHSSPTGSKSSAFEALETSWNQISSIYGDNDSVILTPLKQDKKRSSFTSCKSAIECETTNEELTIFQDTDLKQAGNCMKSIVADTKRLRDNIEELFQDMKLKRNDKFPIPFDNFTCDEVLGNLTISDFTGGSGDLSQTLSEFQS